jgi:uncharacterized protein CbrC (UPF0167 family)
MKLSRKDDNCTIKTLYEKSGDSVKIKEPYEKYDLPIKAIDSEYIKSFEKNNNKKVFHYIHLKCATAKVR